MSFDWNANYNSYSNHGIASTSLTGGFSDNMSINSYNDINLRIDSNNNNTNSYVRIHDNSSGNAQNVAYIGRENGNAIAYFYNRVYGAIYYDRNSTSYYADPASTSRFNSLEMADLLRHRGDTNTYIQFHASDQFRVVTGGSERFEVNNSQIYATRVFRCTQDIIAYYSDERLKDKKGKIGNALSKILSLDGFYYETNDLAKKVGFTEEGLQVGLSAQQVRDVVPEVVHLAPFDSDYDESGNLYSKSGQDYLTIKYDRLIPLVIEGIKDQNKIVTWNNSKVKELEDVIENQQKEINELKVLVTQLINKN